MTIVLAGSRRHYQTFLEKLWERDKTTSGYWYIYNPDVVRGLDRDTRVIRLGSFRQHPNYEEILQECQARFDMNPRRRRFGSDIRYAPLPSFAIPDGRVYLRDDAPEIVSIGAGEMIINGEQSDRLRGLTADVLVVDEPGYSSFSNHVSSHVAQMSRDMSRNIETQMIYGVNGRNTEHSIHINAHTSVLGQIHDSMSEVLSMGARPPENIRVGYSTHQQLLTEISDGCELSPTDQFTLTTQAGQLNIIVNPSQPSNTIVFTR